MSRKHFSFIEDSDIEKIVSDTLDIAKAAKERSKTDFERNVIDPFAALFEMGGFNLSPKDWLKQEQNRQAQKTLVNQLGDFHQRVLGAVDGWENTGRAGGLVDVINAKKKIIAEIKNKHNTIKASDQKNLYETLERLVMDKGQIHKGYTAFYVQIIPANAARFNKPFTPADNGVGIRKAENKLIRSIDGWSFYALATGVDDALEQLFLGLPKLMGLKSDNFKPETVMRYFTAAYQPVSSI
jgi:Eco47II restriction endonuclease